MRYKKVPVEVSVNLSLPKTTLIIVVDKPKEYVRELMLSHKEDYTITYYLPLHTSSVEAIPDYSNTGDWRIQEEGYAVDLIQPQWHPDKEGTVAWTKKLYLNEFGFGEVLVIE